jgi:ArsR family transcriptional regulator, arsenate/arsenite/antimonite-responsive transcriptional repressor
MSSVKEYVTFFAALADENRLRLLHLMRDGEICVCHLQGALKTNQPKISRHLSYLRRAGLVHTRRDGKWIHYSLRKQPAKREAILRHVIKAIQKEAQIMGDMQRAKNIQCAPGRFGLNVPDAERVAARN